jgi:hypothetical protein
LGRSIGSWRRKVKSEIRMRDLNRIIRATIKTAEVCIADCRKELDGNHGTNLHRNQFNHISGRFPNGDDYFDADDPCFAELRKEALAISEERDTRYDGLCKEYLDLEDMTARGFYTEGKIINGADVLNYSTALLRDDNSSEGFDAYAKINAVRHGSDERIESVHREIAVFERYIDICSEKLAVMQ